VVEFVATLLLPKTNVGGYENTGWDLVSNAVGAAFAILCWVAGAFDLRSHDPPALASSAVGEAVRLLGDCPLRVG
jgi:hypothetical protein